ncbi:MAG TPA: TIGR03067 domain-containing protein [Gemmataceae bacterium]|jgi:uncharacterized protein (TIGR03067 family)|nr:TIGR03067 domain-containing protein [Gemmataceae bacterium]
MRRHALLVLAAGCLIAAAPEGDKELAKFNGDWVITTMEVGGKKVPAAELKKGPRGLSLKDGKYQLKGGPEDSGTFTVDTAKKPKQMDIKTGDGNTLLAIYELDGDALKACYAPPGEARPTAFTTKDKPGYVLFEYKRSKPAK